MKKLIDYRNTIKNKNINEKLNMCLEFCKYMFKNQYYTMGDVILEFAMIGVSEKEFMRLYQNQVIEGC